MEKENQIGFQLHILANLIKREFDNRAAKAYREVIGADGVTGTNGWVIGYLYRNKDRDVFQRDLEKEFQIRRSTISKILMSMEKKGLIERLSSTGDARLKQLCLTDKAIRLHKAVKKNIQELEVKLKAGLSEEEVKTFFHILSKIQENIEK